MTRPILFANGHLADDDHPKPFPSDILVGADGIIQAAEPSIKPPEGAEIVDCTGKILLPGLFDVHVHVREPGREDKETIATGSEAAINGGVTAILAMPNTTPAIDSAGMVRFVLSIAKDQSRIPVFTSGCITKGREGKELAEIADMVEKGAVMITDDGSPVSDAYVLRRALEYARNFDVIVASHCETMELSGDGCMNEGPHSYAMGVTGIPACSEEICIDRDCRLAQLTGGRLHIQHVSSARGMEIIRRFKNEGVRVTAEVAPHHLIFADEDIQNYDTHYKMNPPLRTREDNARLLEGLKEGVFDVIATDHAPHTEHEKNLDFSSAPFGITGLETALLSLYQYFIKPGHFGWDLLVKRYADEPRRMLGLPPASLKQGNRADLVVFDPSRSTRIDRAFMRSKSINTPFLDKVLQGSIERVYQGTTPLLARPTDLLH